MKHRANPIPTTDLADSPRAQAALKLSGRLLRILLIAYLGLLLMLSWLQSQLIFPGRTTQGHPAARLAPPPGTELLRLPTSLGAHVAALFGPALTSDGQPHGSADQCPTILFFYGNGMCLADCLDEFQAFRRLGANVLIPDYIGYGLSEGTPGEPACYATADACLDHLTSRPDIDPRRIVAAGWSLGGAVAVDLAARRPLAGLAVFSSFTGMEQLVAELMPWAPSGWLLQHRFESERKIRHVRCPILIGHSRGDEIIPFAMSEKLARAAGGDVVRIHIDDAPHNEFFAAGGSTVLDALRRLLDRSIAPISPHP